MKIACSALFALTLCSHATQPPRLEIQTVVVTGTRPGNPRNSFDFMK